MVGRVMLQLLEERKMRIDTLLPVASLKSVGKEISFNGKKVKIVSMEDAIAAKPEIALFSAGGETSLEWAPKFAAAGTTVIDNSSAWRMHPDHKLIVPEINADILTKKDKIIANPNCSTIQMVMALAPLKVKYGIKRIVVSTYQSISGTGKAAGEPLHVRGRLAFGRRRLLDGGSNSRLWRRWLQQLEWASRRVLLSAPTRPRHSGASARRGVVRFRGRVHEGVSERGHRSEHRKSHRRWRGPWCRSEWHCQLRPRLQD